MDERGAVAPLISCDDDNLASRRVIEANVGVFAETRAHATRRDTQKLFYWVKTADNE